MDEAIKGQKLSDPRPTSHRMAEKNPGPYLHLEKKPSQKYGNRPGWCGSVDGALA